MKKTITLLVVLFIVAGSLVAQSLQDNPDFRRAQELRKESQKAFDEGDYAEARRLAEEAVSYAQKSDEWIATMLDRYRANSALMLVKDRLAQAAVVKAEIHFPDEYAEGKKLYNEAYNLFRDETYIESRQKSLKALDVMQYIRYIPPDVAETGLPAFYEVRLLPGNTDYLFNIAGYDFIYNNHWKWPLLYEANRDLMPEPGNPDLVLPGMILKIPELEGETRSGTWRNGKIE